MRSHPEVNTHRLDSLSEIERHQMEMIEHAAHSLGVAFRTKEEEPVKLLVIIKRLIHKSEH